MLNRKDLIEICKKGIIPSSEWKTANTYIAQEQLGQCWLHLKSGCDFRIVSIEEDFIYLTFSHPVFVEVVSNRKTICCNFYLPTEKQLKKSNGKDWYPC